MTKYTITNLSSGHCFGVYEGATELDAMDALHADAGYRDTASCAAEFGTTVEKVMADHTVEEVQA